MHASSTIRDIEIYPLNLPLIEPFSIATGVQAKVENVLLVVRLHNGLEGIGEAAPFPAVTGENQESTINVLNKLKGHFYKKDITKWKLLFREAMHLCPNAPAARCAFEMAVLDALGKLYNISIATLFGGATSTLTTDMTITAGDVSHAVDSAEKIVKMGFRTIKIKTTGKDIEKDLNRVIAIKKAAPQADIIIDGNGGYSEYKAITFARKLTEAGIKPLFLEQLLPREDWSGMYRLSQSQTSALCADESARSSADVLRILQEKSARLINIKTMKSGIAEALNMIAIAETGGLKLMIGGMVETILSMTFSAHLAAGTGSFEYADLDTPLFIREHPFTGGFIQEKDKIFINQEVTGHGVAVNYELLKKFSML